MIRSLYLKILLHWIAALIVTEALIFTMFILVAGGSHRQYVIRSVGQSASVSRDFVETAVAAEVAKGAAPARALQNAIGKLADSGNANVWVAEPQGERLAASFAGNISAPATDPAKSGHYGAVTVYVNARRGVAWYAVTPLSIPTMGRALQLHLLSRPSPEAFPHAPFALGLALIGALVAVFAVPLTLRITKPLNRLQESALRIAGGDLSARADIPGKDEIGRLAIAFNGMAETVERMVRGGKELTANVSHELRSPLARIRVAGECLKEAVEKGDKREAGEMLEAIWEDIDEADAMIGRILQYSKVDLHEPLSLDQEVTPAELIAGVVKAIGPSARARSISIDLSLIEDEKVTGDADLLRAAFKNLLENAVRHTSEGGDVEVVMWREDESLAVEISNPHPLVGAEEMELIFNPFYRGRQARAEGTGLGLAITKKIITLHHGHISAASLPGRFKVKVALKRKAKALR